MNAFLLLALFISPFAQASGSGYSIGNSFYYNDYRGNSYTVQSIGKFDYVSGSNGYYGVGHQIGNFYYYND